MSRAFLLMLLIVFIGCKIPHLYYPYYWDESWPYAVAIRDMYHHGISLMPDAIDANLSRGHPLLFHAAAATWMHLFGVSHVAMHSFALSIAVLFLIAIYESGLRLYNMRTAILACVLVSSFLIFFVQSSFVLFEVLVAFLCFLSLIFYVAEKYVLAAVCLTALFYTKESGLVMGAVLGFDALFSLFNKRKDKRGRIYRLLSVSVPFILIGVFFLIQKHQKGWYIFPFYNDSTVHQWGQFWYNFRINCLSVVFYFMWRYWYFFLLLAVSLIAGAKNRNVRYLVLFLPATVIYLLVSDCKVADVKNSYLLLALFVATLIFMFRTFRSLKLFTDTRQERTAVFSVAFVVLFCVFSSLNFFTPRYMLAAIVPLFFFMAVIIDKFMGRTDNRLFYPVVILVLSISLYVFKVDAQHGDNDLGAFDAMDVQQKEVDYLEKNNCYEKAISYGGYIFYTHLTEPGAGFLSGERTFKKLDWNINATTDLVVFDNIEPDQRYDVIKKDSGFRLVYRYEKGGLWTEIYRKL